MTPAERAVLARYPDAECWRSDMGYAVFEEISYSADGWTKSQRLGTGPTPEAAWESAAARLDPPCCPAGRDAVDWG